METPKQLGRYQIVRELGRGAMGVVYEGFDPTIGRRVAIKTARCDVMAQTGAATEMMQRFLREARTAGALHHPNIITIYDAGEEDGVAYIAMEYLEGSDLRELLLQRRSVPISERVKIAATICEALAEAHRQGVVHRDIKPGNILMPPGQPLKVADFGIAHVTDSTLTQDGALVGTPHYMSPEQFMGQQVDGRSDLFSVAVMLYELLTGEKPFTGEALSTVMHHVLKTPPAPLSALNYAIPIALNNVILKALSKRPEARYADGDAMAAALRESLKEQPDAAVLGCSSGDAEATVTLTGQNAEETVLMDAATSQEKTAVLPPSPKPSETPTVAATKNTEIPARPLSKKQSKKILWLGLGIGLLIIAAGGGFWYFWSSSTIPEGTMHQPVPATYYETLSFDLYRCRTMEAYMDYNDFESLKRIRDALEGIEEAERVEVFNEKGALTLSVDNYIAGTSLTLAGHPKRLGWRIVCDEQEKKGELNLPADEPQQGVRRAIVFPPLQSRQ